MTQNTSTRLGKILLNKNLITPEQLHIAISTQTFRRQQLDRTGAPSYDATSLGEILIELGFIDRLQLNRGLSWQAIVRKVTLAMSLCAPMLTISYEAAAAVATPVSLVSSSNLSGKALPLTIQAENYSAMSNIQTKTTTDTGGGLYVGWIDANDSMTYSSTAVNIPTTGSYKITYRVASLSGGGSFSFHEDNKSATYDTVSVPSTSGWESWVNVQRTVTLTAGTHKFGVTAITGGFNLNWFKIESLIPPTPSSSSSNVVSFSIPFIVQAENYSAMSNIQTKITTDTGGGLYVGWIDANDSMTYSSTAINIPTTGSYKITYRVASLSGGGSFSFHEDNKSATYDTVSVPSTGDWESWVNVQRTVTLAAGTHKFGITAITGGFNLNWFKIESVSLPGLSSSSSSAVSYSIPLTIQAENYSAMGNIQTATTTDAGGGFYVGWIDANDWLDFTSTPVMVPTTGNYKITYRVASLEGGGSLYLHEAGSTSSYNTASVPRTGNWESWVDVQNTIFLTAGVHNFGITAITGGFNLNWFKIENAMAGSSSSQRISSSSSSPMPASSVASSSSAKSSTVSSSGAVSVAGPVGMTWVVPNKREDGSVLDITEIGGFEIRYKLEAAANFTYVSINDAWTTSYNFPWLEGRYIFQIATFDKNGSYSNFVEVKGD